MHLCKPIAVALAAATVASIPGSARPRSLWLGLSLLGPMSPFLFRLSPGWTLIFSGMVSAAITIKANERAMVADEPLGQPHFTWVHYLSAALFTGACPSAVAVAQARVFGVFKF